MSSRKYKEEAICFYKSLIHEKYMLFFCIAAFFCIFTMYYADITVTAQYGLTFIDSLFDGKLLSFYENALSSGVAPEGAVYDIGTYVIFGIWSIPVWICHKLFGISALSIGSLLWFKLLPTLFYVATVYQVKLVAEEIGFTHDTSSSISLFYMLSLSAFFPVFVAIQYDVIPLFFMLAGIIFYFENDYHKFLLFFAISMTFKPMTLLILVLFVIMRNRNIFRILSGILAGSSIMLLCKVIYSSNSAYRESCGSFLGNSINGVFESGINGSFGNISIFVLLVMGVYVFAYLHKESDDDRKILMLSGFVIWASFCLFGSMTAYWSIYMTPFAVMTVFIASDEENVGRMLFVDLAANALLILLYIMKYSWVYGGDHTYSYLILKPFCKDILNGIQGTTVAGILRYIHVDSIIPAISAVVAVCLITPLVKAVANIRSKNNVALSCNDLKYKFSIIARIAVIYGWIALTLLALFMTNSGV